MTDEELTAKQASAHAVVKAHESREAVEQARLLQNKQIVEETAVRTKEALLEGLKEVFGINEVQNPESKEKMRILAPKIDLLCVSVAQMHSDIAEIKDNMKWATRAFIGAVIVGIVAILFK